MTQSRSLRSRVAVAAALGATVVVLLLAALAWTVLSRNEYNQLDRRLSTVAEVVSPTTVAPDNYLVTIRRGGKITASDGAALPVAPPGVAARTLNGRGYRVLTVQPPGRPEILVSVAAPVAGTRSAVVQLRWEIAAVSAVAIAVAALLGWVFAGRAVRPLRRLTAGARSVGEGPAMLRADGSAETEQLAAEINGMLRRLHESQERTSAALQTAQDFAAAARHELRTPLTAMRTDLEVLGMDRLGETERRQVLADLLRTQSRVQDTLTALGQLAAGDLADPAARTELELTELLFRVAEEAMRVSPEVTVVVRDGPPVVVLGWLAGLRLALDNVVRNAIRHGRASRVELGVAATGGGAELTVEDNGAGMPPDECDRVFGRFARGSNAVGSGSGLGLALVAQQATLHGGSARLEASNLGGVRAVIVVQGFPGHAVRWPKAVGR